MGAGVVVIPYVEEVLELCYTTYCNTKFALVSCLSLTDPNNGMINCSLGDDGVPSYEDTCSFTCNTGYELTGSDTRICQSDGSWSGSDVICRRGTYISCVWHKYVANTFKCFLARSISRTATPAESLNIEL